MYFVALKGAFESLRKMILIMPSCGDNDVIRAIQLRLELNKINRQPKTFWVKENEV